MLTNRCLFCDCEILANLYLKLYLQAGYTNTHLNSAIGMLADVSWSEETILLVTKAAQ